MINTKVKTILKLFLKILWSVFAIIGIVFVCGILFLIFDEKGRCLDAGKVYDPEQKICRDDCLTWDDKLGCIPITLENQIKSEKGLPFS